MSDFVFYPKLRGGDNSGGLACHVVAEPVSGARWRESDKVYNSTGGDAQLQINSYDSLG